MLDCAIPESSLPQRALLPSLLHHWLVRQPELPPRPLLLPAAKLSQEVQAGVDWHRDEIRGSLLQAGLVAAGDPLLVQGLHEGHIGLDPMPVLHPKGSNTLVEDRRQKGKTTPVGMNAKRSLVIYWTAQHTVVYQPVKL